MREAPYLQQRGRNRSITTDFRGLNLSQGIGDGEWAWMQNMDTREYPAVARRQKRVHVATLNKPNGLCATDRLCFVDGVKFYYNGFYYGDVEDSEKTLVPMGAKIAIFPDKKLFDTTTFSFTDMEQKNVSSGTVRVTLAKGDGTPYGEYTEGDTAPENPENGQLWLDTSGDAPVMKTWSEAQGLWVAEATTYVLVSATGLGQGLKALDGVTVSGLEEGGLNGDWILTDAGPDYILFTGILQKALTQTGEVRVERICPEMDFVVEKDNRLWGCSSADHEIYCCKLGDPTNWRAYQGVATDSYAVTVGTPGPFTGAAVSGSAVIFFKENCLHRVYGTQPSNFTVYVDNLRGVQQGCHKSAVRVNEYLYYKSVFDVCVYADSEVAGISAALGTESYKNAVAGVCGNRLYLSMEDQEGAWQLLVYDTAAGVWTREDGTHALGFASCLTETFMLRADGELYALLPGEYNKDFFMVGSDYTVYAQEETDEEVSWELRTGEILRELPDHKYIGKIQLYLELDPGARAEVALRRDGGAWEKVQELSGGDQRRCTLPIYPRRCDRMEIRLTGVGHVRLVNWSKYVGYGSEY